MSGFYAAYHGAEGLKQIANRVLRYRQLLLSALKWCDVEVDESEGFDTVRFKGKKTLEDFNVRYEDGWTILSLDECTTIEEIALIVHSQYPNFPFEVTNIVKKYEWMGIPLRKKPWLTQEVFNKYQSETNMMRYIYELASKDFSLVNGMIPLGSCTMKLNAAAELMPVSWNEFSNMHPFVPEDQTVGYQRIIFDLKEWLCDITGFADISLQPNAGSQGEYAGLLAIQLSLIHI